MTSTDAEGQIYTVTEIVHNPTPSGTSSSAAANNGSFFENTGAVAGIFVVVGLAITAGVISFIFFMLRRRRRQRLDRDVAAAAAAAAAAANHHSRSTFDDDEEKPAISQYGGYYAATTPAFENNGQPQPETGAYDYEDPAGGYDLYAHTLSAGNRTSTATGPGLAGFGAQSAQASYAEPVAGFDSHGYETLAQPDYHVLPSSQHGASSEYYFDPKQAFDYAEEDAYGGFDEDEHQPPSGHRSSSGGSTATRGREHRGLKVTNF